MTLTALIHMAHLIGLRSRSVRHTLAWWYAESVFCIEHVQVCRFLSTAVSFLIAAIRTVLHAIAVPGYWDTVLIFTLELVLRATMVTWYKCHVPLMLKISSRTQTMQFSYLIQ